MYGLIYGNFWMRRFQTLSGLFIQIEHEIFALHVHSILLTSRELGSWLQEAFIKINMIFIIVVVVVVVLYNLYMIYMKTVLNE